MRIHLCPGDVKRDNYASIARVALVWIVCERPGEVNQGWTGKARPKLMGMSECNGVKPRDLSMNCFCRFVVNPIHFAYNSLSHRQTGRQKI